MGNRETEKTRKPTSFKWHQFVAAAVDAAAAAPHAAAAAAAAEHHLYLSLVFCSHFLCLIVCS